MKSACFVHAYSVQNIQSWHWIKVKLIVVFHKGSWEMYLKSCIFSFSCPAPALNFTYVLCMYEIWVIEVHCCVVLYLYTYVVFCTNMILFTAQTCQLPHRWSVLFCAKKIILLEKLSRVVILYTDTDRFKHVLSIEVEIYS
jgi:hypothetical protein